MTRMYSSNRKVVERRLKHVLQAIDNLVSSGKSKDSFMLFSFYFKVLKN